MKPQLIFLPCAESPIWWLVEIGQLQLGFQAGTGWCICSKGQFISISAQEDMVSMLPLLELSRSIFYCHLEKVAQAVPDLPGTAFPEMLLIKCAFETSVSDYWPQKAMDWLDAGANIPEELQHSLRVLTKQRWASQRLRHRAMSILRKSAKK